jgi:hypothetical protein
MLRMRSTFSREIFRISLDVELGLYTYTRRDNLYFAFVHRATATSKTSEGSSLIIYFCSFSCINIWYYNIAFVNSERWLAKSRVDIIQCQHGNVGKFLSLCFFVLYYKTNIKHFFRIDTVYRLVISTLVEIGKTRNCVKHYALRASCFHAISRYPNFHSCWYNCISTRKMFYIC